PVSVTQATEYGTLYTIDEIAAISDVAGAYNLPVHMDGARFANALVALGCTPAEMTWKAGVDAVSFGGTKNGLMGVEAVIFFDPKHAWEFELRRKRAAHLFSKHRYLSAQMTGYLKDDLWLELAGAANAAASRLERGLRTVREVSFSHVGRTNMLRPRFPHALHQRLHENGAVYHMWEGELKGDDPTEILTARLVCDWSVTNAEVDRFIEIARG
ncbi:MAG: low specificity L-threonine aldolase, partial [Halocynthiibacter sp.]